MMKRIVLLLSLVFFVAACSDRQGKDIQQGTTVQETITYQAEPDSPWGSFTVPVKEATYTIEAPRSQEDETMVPWLIEVENVGEDLGVNADNINYPEGTIREYFSRRQAFKVSACDSAKYWFSIKKEDWRVKTLIIKEN